MKQTTPVTRYQTRRTSVAHHYVKQSQTSPYIGAYISTLRGLSAGVGPVGLGRIGCFAVRRSARTWNHLALISNSHTLAAHGGRQGDVVYQPHLETIDSQINIHRDSLNPVATLTANGFDGHYRYAFPGERAKDYYIDSATALMSCTKALPSGEQGFTNIAPALPQDTRPNRRLPVRLLGIHQHVAGYVTDTRATVPHTDGRLCQNSIVIETIPGHPPFATNGDSGALLVDSFNRAIGLLWGVDLAKPTRAFACHLLPILDRLKLVPSSLLSITDVRQTELLA